MARSLYYIYKYIYIYIHIILCTPFINTSLRSVLELLPPLHKSGQTEASLEPSLLVCSKYVSYCSSEWLIDQKVKLKRVP